MKPKKYSNQMDKSNSSHDTNIMKEAIGTTIIDVEGLFSQDNNASKSLKAIDSLTQRDNYHNLFDQDNTPKALDKGNPPSNLFDQDKFSFDRFINPGDTFENLNVRYLNASLFDSNADIIACKSAKGTGKSHALKQVLANEPSIINLTHRRQLSKELASRWGLDYISEDNLHTSMRLSMCVDSLPKFVDYSHCASLNRWKDGIVVMDECEQVLWHALYSDTCYKERIEVLRALSILIQNA